MTDLDRLWNALLRAQTLAFVADGTGATRWSGTGTGTVATETPGLGVLLFHESGDWRMGSGRELSFRNTYRWTRLSSAVRLEHLRFGQSEPVYLFDLRHENGDIWTSDAPHLCRADEYAARLQISESCVIHLHWTVTGATKNERIAYTYYPAPAKPSPNAHTTGRVS